MLRDVKRAQARYIEELAAQARAQAEATSAMRHDLAALVGQVDGYVKARKEIQSVVATVVQRLVRVYAAMGGSDSSRLSIVADLARKEAAARYGTSPAAAAEGASAAATPATASSSKSSSASAGPSSSEAPSLVISRDDVITVLGDLEQLASDTCMSFLTALQSGTGRRCLLEAIEGLEAAVTAELGALSAAEAAAAASAATAAGSKGVRAPESDDDGSGPAPIRPSAFSPAGRARYEHLLGLSAEYSAMRESLANVTPEECDAMMRSLRREPVAPAKAVAPQPLLEQTLAPSLERLTMAPAPTNDSPARRVFGGTGKKKAAAGSATKAARAVGGGGGATTGAQPPPPIALSASAPSPSAAASMPSPSAAGAKGRGAAAGLTLERLPAASSDASAAGGAARGAAGAAAAAGVAAPELVPLGASSSGPVPARVAMLAGKGGGAGGSAAVASPRGGATGVVRPSLEVLPGGGPGTSVSVTMTSPYQVPQAMLPPERVLKGAVSPSPKAGAQVKAGGPLAGGPSLQRL
jgi:hypothetical protein